MQITVSRNNHYGFLQVTEFL